MAGALAHRGPDEGGIWHDEVIGVGLAHRRLSILDLSEAGRQPMFSEQRRYVIVFNGEIYNHHALREDLIRLEPRACFRGHSDTEEILAACEAWGIEATVTRLNGMFAFALYDTHERKLHLCRDRLGEKPLYFGRLNGGLVFGSELKGIRSHPNWSDELDLEAVQTYFHYGYVTGARSIYSRIGKVLPGEWVTVDVGLPGLPVTRRHYWSAADVVLRNLDQPLRLSDGEAIEELEFLLNDAVKLRMEADVPLGAFLSGGVDSSTIVALMQRNANKPIRTFSIGFGEKMFNEAESAKFIAQHLGTEHTEFYVSPHHALEVIPELPVMYDEPFADSSQIPTYLVAKLARQHVTVGLSGDGGDELFGGYSRYDLTKSLWGATQRIPRAMRSVATRAMRAVPIETWDALSALLPPQLTLGRAGDRVHKLARCLAFDSFNAMYSDRLSLGSGEYSVLASVRNSPMHNSVPLPILGIQNVEERMMAWDLVQYLPDDILVKLDRATMAISLEGRIPLLDHRVVEFAWGLPLHLKRRNGTNKWLLKQLLYRMVPRSLIDRPKQGFRVPIEHWLRNELREWADDLLSTSALAGHPVLNASNVRRMYEEHIEGRRSWAAQLWAILTFQAWYAGRR